MGKLSGEFREPNRKDKVTRFPFVSYARQLGLLVNILGSHLKHEAIIPNITSDRHLPSTWQENLLLNQEIC